MTSSAADRTDRVRNALWGLFAGDALAMPAHWYYSLSNLRRDFDGGVLAYEAPPHPHPEAFMVGMTYRPDVESATRLGRPYDILHDHARFYETTYSELGIELKDWESEHGNAVAAADERYHYHHGLRAGENTLNAHLVRALLRTVSESGGYDQDAFLAAMVEHMTTPGRNRDPYTEIFLRHWFENFSRGIPAYASADYQRRVWSIGSHGGIIRPLVVGLIPRTDYQAVGWAGEHQNLTHRSENNLSALAVLVPLLRSLVEGADAASAADRAASQIHVPAVDGESLFRAYRDHGGPGGIPRDEMWRLHTEFAPEPYDLAGLAETQAEDQVVRTRFATACYPEHGVPLSLYLARRHGFDVREALLANANAGGDNVNRGMVLGLLVGAASVVPDDLKSGLADAAQLDAEIEGFLGAIG